MTPSSTASSSNVTGDIQYMRYLNTPITGGDKKDKQLVKIFGLGNVEGHSPAVWIITQAGAIETRATADVVVLDPNFLPPGNRAFNEFAQFNQGGGSYGSANKS